MVKVCWQKFVGKSLLVLRRYGLNNRKISRECEKIYKNIENMKEEYEGNFVRKVKEKRIQQVVVVE